MLISIGLVYTVYRPVYTNQILAYWVHPSPTSMKSIVAIVLIFGEIHTLYDSISLSYYILEDSITP